MVWSTTARNIGSMIEGNTRKNRPRVVSGVGFLVAGGGLSTDTIGAGQAWVGSLIRRAGAARDGSATRRAPPQGAGPWGRQPPPLPAGDTVWIPPNEKHWHGAGPQTGMVHVAMQEALDGKHVTWLEHVTDEQYSAPLAG